MTNNKNETLYVKIKKMKKYLITFLIVFSCLQITQAQSKNHLIYKEYDPDYWVELTDGQHFDIDINDDGIIDVRYDVYQGGSGSIYLASDAFAVNDWAACSHCIQPIGYNNIFYELSTPLNDSSLVWDEQCLAQYYTYGQVPPLFYKVGLRFCDEQDCYYGWIEFEEDRASWNALFHISRTCFCAIPNYPLVWGQTSLTDDIGENEATAFATLYPNPTTGQVTILGQDLQTAEVINTLGQCVATAKGEGERLTVDISNLPAGIYFVNVTDGEGRKCVKKVVKE